MVREMNSCSVIICTKDRCEDLRRCLDSLRKQTRLPDELVIVDSGSDDAEQAVKEFARDVPECSVQYHRSEPGLTKQRNIGIARATKDIVHFFDDDIVCDAKYVEEAQGVFDADGGGEILAAGPRVTLSYEPSRLGLRFRRLFLLPNVAGDGRLLPSGFGTFTWYGPQDGIHDVQVLCGCCCAFRSSVFDKALFDDYFEGYGYMEDIEFTCRVAKFGRMVCNPKAMVVHLESKGARTPWRRLMAMQIKNHHYVFTKHVRLDASHWFCFWWSELGEGIRRVAQMAKTFNAGIAMGMVDGYLALLRGTLRRSR